MSPADVDLARQRLAADLTLTADQRLALVELLAALAADREHLPQVVWAHADMLIVELARPHSWAVGHARARLVAARRAAEGDQ